MSTSIIEIVPGRDAAKDVGIQHGAPLLVLSNMADRLGEYICSPLRFRPVVVFSRDKNRGHHLPYGFIAAALRNVADVVVLKDEQAAFALTGEVGRDLSCFWGAARVINPGFSLREIKANAPIIMADVLSDNAPDLIVRMINTMAEDLGDIPTIGQPLKAKKAKPVKTSAPKKSVIEVADDAEKLSHLVILPEAKRSARVSPYKNTTKLQQCLEGVNAVTARWAEEGFDGFGWRDAMKEHGIDWKTSISDTTKSMFGEEYVRMYKGEYRMFDAHFTLGVKMSPETCISVHGFVDQESRKMAIGHIGRHLTNTKTS